MEVKTRKPNRLENYDYSQNGAYFITVCTKNRRNILSKIIVGTGVPDSPKIKLLYHGEIADRYIKQLNGFYHNVSVDKYVIMPDHIHFILNIQGGQSRTPVPTNFQFRFALYSQKNNRTLTGTVIFIWKSIKQKPIDYSAAVVTVN